MVVTKPKDKEEEEDEEDEKEDTSEATPKGSNINLFITMRLGMMKCCIPSLCHCGLDL